VERRGIRRNRGAAVEQDERLGMPFHAFGDLEKDVIVALAPDLETDHVAVEGPHCREVTDAQGKLAEHRNRWWDDLARGWLARRVHGPRNDSRPPRRRFTGRPQPASSTRG